MPMAINNMSRAIFVTIVNHLMGVFGVQVGVRYTKNGTNNELVRPLK